MKSNQISLWLKSILGYKRPRFCNITVSHKMQFSVDSEDRSMFWACAHHSMVMLVWTDLKSVPWQSSVIGQPPSPCGTAPRACSSAGPPWPLLSDVGLKGSARHKEQKHTFLCSVEKKVRNQQIKISKWILKTYTQHVLVFFIQPTSLSLNKCNNMNYLRSWSVDIGIWWNGAWQYLLKQLMRLAHAALTTVAMLFQ